MKISKIKFNDYLHFDPSLELDLTYPKGHVKEGQPLDKVCFIGQSGTGKTSILNLIKYFTADGKGLNREIIDHDRLGQNSVEIYFEIDGESICKSPHGGDREGFAYKKNGFTQNSGFHKDLENKVNGPSPILISFPFNVIPPDATPIPTGVDDFEKTKGIIDNKKSARIWDITTADINSISSLVFQNVDTYVEKHSKVSNEYLDKAKTDTSRSQEFVQDIIKWEQQNPNPIKEIAENFLSEILDKIGLTVETDVKKYYHKDSEARKNLENFFILTQQGQHIKLPFLSTGTKQIIYTSIPLFFLKPKNSIILLDQPEASLYPDIQLLVPNIYTQMAPDSQFFFATHSPIIASAFDPWEIVELDFDKRLHRIKTKKYYDGDRAVANYVKNPRFLRWDSIFKLMLGMKVEGGDERTEKLMELASLESRLKRLKTKEEKVTVYAEYSKLAKMLDLTTLTEDEKD